MSSGFTWNGAYSYDIKVLRHFWRISSFVVYDLWTCIAHKSWVIISSWETFITDIVFNNTFCLKSIKYLWYGLAYNEESSYA